MAHVEQLEYGRWYVMCSLLPCGTDIMYHLFLILYCVSIHFYSFLSSCINNLEWSIIPACPSLM